MAASSTTGAAVAEENLLSLHTNGGETSQNGPRRWEKPWPLHEIHAEAGSWSLAGDAGLLQHLQEFSQRMISHTHQIGKEVDDLLHDAKLMDVRVNNVINDFIMLANTQFVENRVYDEDVSEEMNAKEEKKLQQEKTKEQREIELIPRVAFALKLGINVIDNAFERLDTKVVDSDSEEEDGGAGISEAILEAKDPYVTRPLPFLIGTPQFMEDDNIGLVDDLSDEEPESDQGSISVSEDDDDAESEESQREYSTSEESEEADRKSAEVKKRAQTGGSSSTSDDDSDQDMFSVKRSRTGRSSDDSAHSGDVSASDEEEPQSKARPVPPTGIPKDFSSELASRLGVGAPTRQTTERAKSDEEENGWNEKSDEQKRKDSLSSGKHPKDVQSGKKENERVEGKADKLKNKHPKQMYEDDSLFGQDERQDEDDDLFSKGRGLFSSSKGLFDDDDEGDLFQDVKKPPVKTQKPNKKEEKSKRKDESLFADDFHSEEAEGDDRMPLPKPKTSSTHTVKKPTAQPAAVTGKAVGKGGGLFDESEDDNDDLFGEASKKVDLSTRVENFTPSKKTAIPAAKKSDLFVDGTDDDNDDLFGSIAASVVKSKPHSNVGLTVEGYDEVEKVEEKRLEDEQLRKKATPEKKLPPGAVSMFGKGPNPIIEALRKQQQIPSSSDEDENLSLTTEDQSSRKSSIQSTSSATSAQKVGENAKIVPFYGSNILADSEDDADDFLFSSKPKSGSKTVVEKDGNASKNISKTSDRHQEKSDKIKSSKGSLFDSSGDDNDNDIFSSAIKPIESKKPEKQVSLFGDADIEATKGDKEVLSNLISQSAGMKKGSGLFDDDDEEPLFSNKPSQSSGKSNTSKNKTQDLFAHDDAHSFQDEDPSVDLFSNKEPIIEPLHNKELQQPVITPGKKSTPTSKPATTNLFCEDDDEDGGLFSVRSIKPRTAMPTATSVTETESSDAIKENKSQVKEHPKAVSLFDGLDPSSVSDNKKLIPEVESIRKDEKEVKKDEKRTFSEMPKTANLSLVKPLSTPGLFEGDDDDDDLFSSKAGVTAVTEVVTAKESADIPDKEVAVTSKPEQKPKKPAGAVSIFGAADPSSFLKKEESKEEKNEGLEKKKTPPPQIAAKPKMLNEKSKNIVKSKSLGSADLFANDGNDNDGLFSTTTKKTTPPPIAPKSRALSIGIPVAAEELPKPEREATLPESGRSTRLPPGAVSIFGGSDPFAAMKKTSLSSEVDQERESSSHKEIVANLTLYNDPLSVLTSPVTMPSTNQKLVTPNTLAKVKVQDTGLSTPISVDFDQPVETETLTSAGKDRPKLNRRRPQSRKARVLAAAQTSIDFEDSVSTSPVTSYIPPQSLDSPTPSGPTPLPPNIAPQSSKATSPPQSKTPLPPPSETSLPPPSGATAHLSHRNHLHNPEEVKPTSKFNLFGEDDLLDGLKDKLHTFPVQGPSNIDRSFSSDLFNGKDTKFYRESTEDLFTDLDKNNLLGSKSITETSDTTKTKIAKNKDTSDLFSKPVDNSTADDLSSILFHKNLHSTPFASTKHQTDITNDFKDDGLFVPSANTTTAKSKTITEKAKDDDLFSAFQSSSLTGRPKIGQETTDIFHEDDIFGNSSLSKQKDSKPKLGSGTTEHDDVKDIKKSDNIKSARSKRVMAKESNLLKDTTDIFSDVPTLAPRELKKKTPKKVTEKNLVQEDIDDIFADSTVVTIKPKRDVRKKLTKPTTVVSDNIFDDPLS